MSPLKKTLLINFFTNLPIDKNLKTLHVNIYVNMSVSSACKFTIIKKK